jgi:superfamily II DNA/RNA helicase
MPTSAGKTRVAELAIVHTLISHPGARCVYVAPYRALVGEVQQAFVDLFSDLGFQVPLIVGSYETDELEEALAGQADVLIVTPEKLDLLFRLQPEIMDAVRLLILDEGHMLDQIDRGSKFELLLTRLKQRLTGARVIALSAVVPQQTLADFAEWFGAGERGVIESDWRPSTQRIARFEWRGGSGVLDYAAIPDAPILPGFVPGVIRPATYEFINPETLRRNRKVFPEPKNKSQTAAELSYKFAELGPVLVFCSQTNFVLSVGKALLTRLEYATLTDQRQPSYLLDTSGTRSSLVAEEWLGSDHVVTKLLRAGVALHHGGLPDAVRKAVEQDFRERKYRILIATNTLAQGVNLPLRTVIIHSCWRTAADEAPQRMSARDYWNIAGRAGRAREETEGTIIHIVLTPNDERDFEYYLQRRENVEAVQSALFQVLQALVGGRLDEGIALDYVDPEVLALLVEEHDVADLDGKLRRLLDASLVRIQAERAQLPLEPLRRVLNRSASAILERAPAGTLPVFAQTGLSSQSCLRIYEHARDLGDAMRDMLRSADRPSFGRLRDAVLEACLGLPELQSERAFSGNVRDLLERWMDGTSYVDLRRDFLAESASAEELARFIDDAFGYRLPWGASSYLRLAEAALGVLRPDMSLMARFLPSMIKFGVPTPQAVWAIVNGVPLRRVAIELGDRFVASSDDSMNIAAFASWLRNLEPDELSGQYGLSGELLQDVARSLGRTGPNSLLREFRGVNTALPLRAAVRGISFGQRAAIASEVRVGTEVGLNRDYDAILDRNAVEVIHDGAAFGYLPRQIAQLIAPELDSGVRFPCVVVEIKRGATPSVVVEVLPQQ